MLRRMNDYNTHAQMSTYTQYNAYIERSVTNTTRERERERERERGSPAVDQDGVVSSSPLNLPYLFNDIYDCLDVARAAIRSPVEDVELIHLMGLVSLYNTAQLETQPNRERGGLYLAVVHSKTPDSKPSKVLLIHMFNCELSKCLRVSSGPVWIAHLLQHT